MTDPQRLPASLRSLIELHPSLVMRAVRRRDLGYACYLYFGVMLTVAFVLDRLPTDTWFYAVVADHFGATVLFGFGLAGLVGVWVSAVSWRDWPLLLLGLLTVAIPAILWSVSGRSGLADRAAGGFFATYTILALALPARWFLSLRGRLLAAADPRD